MPPLSTSNLFDVLEVYSIEDNSTDLTDEMTAQDVQQTLETLPTPKASPTYPVRLKRWERQLPRKYVVATTPSANSLNIKVEIVTTDTQETKSMKAFLTVELMDFSSTGTTFGRTSSLPEPLHTHPGVQC